MVKNVLCTFESFVKDVLLYNEHKLIKLETEKRQQKTKKLGLEGQEVSLQVSQVFPPR